MEEDAKQEYRNDYNELLGNNDRSNSTNSSVRSLEATGMVQVCLRRMRRAVTQWSWGMDREGANLKRRGPMRIFWARLANLVVTVRAKKKKAEMVNCDCIDFAVIDGWSWSLSWSWVFWITEKLSYQIYFRNYFKKLK